MRLALLVLFAAVAHAQPLRGVIDLHVHTDPDSVPAPSTPSTSPASPRAAACARSSSRAIGSPTASLAFLVRKAVPGIEIFGGIDLNRSVGGINPTAVERMASIKGGWGRVVWMPTFDAENQVRYSKEDRPFVAVSKGGELLPEVKEVIAHRRQTPTHSRNGALLARRVPRADPGGAPAGSRADRRHSRDAGAGRDVDSGDAGRGEGRRVPRVRLQRPDRANKAFEIGDYVKAIRAVGARS